MWYLYQRGYLLVHSSLRAHAPLSSIIPHHSLRYAPSWMTSKLRMKSPLTVTG